MHEQPGPRPEDHSLLQLQRTHGNQAVQRLVTEVKPKLAVGRSDDARKRDAIARVVHTSQPPTARGLEGDAREGRVQRMCSRCRARFEEGKPLDCPDCETELRRGGSSGLDRQPSGDGGTKAKGEDEDEEAKIKRKTEIGFSVVRGGLPPSRMAGGKPKACPAPAPAAQRHNHLGATPAQIAAMGGCTWGITVPDDLGIRTETCRDGANWRLVVTRVNSVIRSHSRLLPGQSEPVPGSNTTNANFCNQATELDLLGSCGGSWYMIRAVRAHEEVHVNEWQGNFTTDWNSLEAAIEGMSVPASGATKDKAAATAALRSRATFTNARDTSNAGGNFPTFWGIADPNATTDAAERAVVDPRITWICRHARGEGWNPAACPVCASLGIV